MICRRWGLSLSAPTDAKRSYLSRKNGVAVHGRNIKIKINRNKWATGQRYLGDNGWVIGAWSQADSDPVVRRSFDYSRIVPANEQSLRVPWVTLRSRTTLQIICSAGLFVGGIPARINRKYSALYSCNRFTSFRASLSSGTLHWRDFNNFFLWIFMRRFHFNSVMESRKWIVENIFWIFRTIRLP